MTTSRYANLAYQAVELTADEIRSKMPDEYKGDYEPAPEQIVSPGQPVLLFHKPEPANDNQKPEEQPADQAETALRKLYDRNPRLKKLVAAYNIKQPRPNRAKLKTQHAPKPAQPATQPVASEFNFKDIIRHYQELQPEAEIAPLPLRKAGKCRGELKLLHTVESLIEEAPLPKKSTMLKKLLIHGAELLLTAA